MLDDTPYVYEENKTNVLHSAGTKQTQICITGGKTRVFDLYTHLLFTLLVIFIFFLLIGVYVNPFTPVDNENYVIYILGWEIDRDSFFFFFLLSFHLSSTTLCIVEVYDDATLFMWLPLRVKRDFFFIRLCGMYIHYSTPSPCQNIYYITLLRLSFV